MPSIESVFSGNNSGGATLTSSDNEDFNRAMVVVAHADDAEWGCAGTVARWCAEGKHVVYVVCTDGSKGT